MRQTENQRLREENQRLRQHNERLRQQLSTVADAVFHLIEDHVSDMIDDRQR